MSPTSAAPARWFVARRRARPRRRIARRDRREHRGEGLGANHGDPPAADTINADDLFGAVEDVPTDVRDAPGIPKDVLQDLPGVPRPSFADALEALAAAHQAASG